MNIQICKLYCKDSKYQLIVRNLDSKILDFFLRFAQRKISKFSPRFAQSKILKLKQNLGLPRALNYGLAHINSDWVARFDADDLMVPNRLELQKNFVEY